jgi:hypothetical protein
LILNRDDDDDDDDDDDGNDGDGDGDEGGVADNFILVVVKSPLR